MKKSLGSKERSIDEKTVEKTIKKKIDTVQETMKIPVIYLRDKQAFSNKTNRLAILGKPIDLAKKLKKEGADLIHIVDLDLEKGNIVNFDTYDHLTYFIHAQVEGARDEKTVKRLVDVGMRTVIPLPTLLNLKKFSKNKRLLVGKITNPEDASDDVFDLLYSGTKKEELESLLKTGRRIISLNNIIVKGKQKLFGVLYLL